jgi:hypothetical protein
MSATAADGFFAATGVSFLAVSCAVGALGSLPTFVDGSSAFSAWEEPAMRRRQSYVVAQRYHRRLRLFNAPKNFVTRLYELRDIVKDGCSDEDAKKFKKKVDDLVEATTNKLNEPRR